MIPKSNKFQIFIKFKVSKKVLLGKIIIVVKGPFMTILEEAYDSISDFDSTKEIRFVNIKTFSWWPASNVCCSQTPT